MLTIYNTLTKRKEEFKPLEENKVKMYVCGPTVYDYFHIGNARSFIMADMIRRYLEFKGYEVSFAMNITDVDDKIIKKANEEKTDSGKIANRYTEAFLEDIEKLLVKRATFYPKATEHMQDIIDMIKRLEERGLAYNADGDVFYSVSGFKEYGKLSGKRIEDLESGARIEINKVKKDPMDFSLWKKAKEGEPYWESPWGNGRPGWHIECSAMSCKHLGETFDIHAGGNDLIFPHHENEIAQSEGATGKKFVNYWLHFGFLNLNDEKMSKSLGNFFTARDILKKYPAEAVRLLFAQTHYGGPLNFSDELLAAANKGVEKIQNLKETLQNHLKSGGENGSSSSFNFEGHLKSFEAAMDDDFNTPQAAAVIFDFVKDVNKTIASGEKQSMKFYEEADNFLRRTAAGVLGILDYEKASASGGELQEELINFIINLRQQAKADKNYQLSDRIREGLKEMGILLQDSKEGTTYKVSR